MSKRTDHHDQVVIENEDSTEVWEKNSVGCTTKEGYSKVVDGERYDYWGNHVSKA